MKTLIVICSLATIAITVPTPLQENFDITDSVLENLPDSKIREKKSPLHDPSQGLTLDNGKGNTQTRHSHKIEVEIPSSGKTKVGFRKPIIIKKKFGYHVYRDSDEEMAHADPYEKCRKQFKVKLCDTEPSLQIHSNNLKSVLSERSHEITPDKEMENSLKMAKEAVENLERDLQKMEHNSVKKSNSKENLDSGITLQKDIEMAKSALEHIQKNMGNLETIEFQLKDPELKETQKSINHWKEAIDDIHKNVEIARNIEDAFKFETQNLHHSENMNIPKTSETEHLADQQIKKTYDSEFFLNKNAPQSSISMKTVYEDNNNDPELSSKLKNSSTEDEKHINVENYMFVPTTDHKESKMKLHSESLTRENILDKNPSIDHDTKSLNFNTNDHSINTKSSEILTQDSGYKNINTANTDLEGTEIKDYEKSVEPGLPLERNALYILEKNNDINPPKLSPKSAENAKNSKLTKDSHIESTMSNDKGEEEAVHKHTVKSTEVVTDQTNLETKSSVKEKIAFEHKTDPTLSELVKISDTEQKNSEHRSNEYSDMNNIQSNQPRMTLLKEKEPKDKVRHVLLQLDNNSAHQKHFDIHETKSLDKENGINDEERDLNKAFNLHSPQAKFENTHLSSLTLVGPREEQHVSNEFSSMRMPENHNMNHMQNENHETKDFQLNHLTQEKDHTNSRMNKNSNIEEHLNDFHESFMRLAQEKQLNDILSEQFKTVTDSNSEYKKNLQTKTNEFRNEYMLAENARMNQIHNMGQQLHGSDSSLDFISIPLTSSKRPNDHSTQHFKSITEFHNDHLLPTSSETNGLRNADKSLSGYTSMQLTEDKNNENTEHEFNESQHLNNPLLTERLAQEKQQKGFRAFKTVSEFHNDMLLTPTKTNGLHSGHHAHKGQTSMRISEDQNLGQFFTDSHELHDPYSMRWAHEKQQDNDLAQIFDTEAEFHDEPHLNDHLQKSMPTNRFNNNFDLDRSHDVSLMRARMPDHFHIMKHANYDMDNSMQPSMHIGMRDSDMQRGHHHHHGMARSSYSPTQLNAGASSDTMGVFSNANTGGGIPLLFSCSPSVVSGSLTKAQPMRVSAPAYRTGDNLMYYMKRDANKVEGKTNVKIQKAPIYLYH